MIMLLMMMIVMMMMTRMDIFFVFVPIEAG